MPHHLSHELSLWIMHYGSFALLVLLALGIFALPIPDESLLVFAGALIAKDKLSVVPTIMAAYLGAMCGITLSYLVGRIAGIYLIKKYGYWLRITDEKMQRVACTGLNIGKWTLLFGYFYPYTPFKWLCCWGF